MHCVGSIYGNWMYNQQKKTMKKNLRCFRGSVVTQKWLKTYFQRSFYAVETNKDQWSDHFYQNWKSFAHLIFFYFLASGWKRKRVLKIQTASWISEQCSSMLLKNSFMAKTFFKYLLSNNGTLKCSIWMYACIAI